MTTALATVDNALLAPITAADDFERKRAAFVAQRVNLLTPYSSLGFLAPMHAVQPVVVFIDPDPNSQEVYASTEKNRLIWLNPGEVAIAKKGLRKIVDAFGGKITTEDLSHTDVRNYWKVRATIEYRDIDGTHQVRCATQEWDLRDGSDRMRANISPTNKTGEWSPAQKAEQRKSGLRQCEARAINAAIREMGAGLKQKYTTEELRRPFVAMRVIVNLDTSDPEIRRMVAAKALDGSRTLFAHESPRLQSAPIDAEIVQATSNPPTQTTPQGQPEQGGTVDDDFPDEPTTVNPAADPNTPPNPRALKVTVVEGPATVKNQTTGREAQRWTATFSDGQVATFFSSTIAEDLKIAKAAGVWVEPTIVQKGQYRNVTAVKDAVADGVY